MGCGSSSEEPPAEEVPAITLEEVLAQIRAARAAISAANDELTATAASWHFYRGLAQKVATHSAQLAEELGDQQDECRAITLRIAELDADEVFEASDGLGTDEVKMARVILGRTREQVALTDRVYRAKYGRSLEDQVRGENKSMLGLLTGSLSHFGRFLVYRCQPPAQRDAFLLYAAMQGAGTSDYILMEILSTRTNGELRAAAAAYAAAQDGASLQERIQEETGGFGKADYGRWCDALVEFNREEGLGAVDAARAEAQADELYEAGAAKMMGCDEQVFIDILTKASEGQCAAIAAAYEAHEDTNRSLAEDVKKKFSGDLEFAVLARVLPRLEFFAYRIYKACKGWGTDEECIGRVLACLTKEEAKELEAAYEGAYGAGAEEEAEGDLATLRGALASELSGDFLLAINHFLDRYYCFHCSPAPTSAAFLFLVLLSFYMYVCTYSRLTPLLLYTRSHVPPPLPPPTAPHPRATTASTPATTRRRRRAAPRWPRVRGSPPRRAWR